MSSSAWSKTISVNGFVKWCVIAVRAINAQSTALRSIFRFQDVSGIIQPELERHIDTTSSAGEVSAKRWTRLDATLQATSRLIDTHVINLKNGLSWHFDMQGSVFMTETQVPKQYLAFASKVKIDAKQARRSSFDPPFIVSVYE